MNVLAALSLLTSLAIGTTLSFLLWPSARGGAAAALRLCAGFGLGMGLTSSLYFIALSAGLTRFVPAVDLGLCLLLGIPAFRLFRKKDKKCPARGGITISKGLPIRSRFLTLLAGIFSIGLAASVASFFMAFLKEPHGRWDAWFIWNMHARFLFRSGEQWRDAFASGMGYWGMWDYPLLLPLAIVRSWNWMGTESSLTPALIAFLFTFLTIGLLAAGLAVLKSRSSGYLAAMVLMGSPFFIFMGASQFADIPFAFFMLATLVMLLAGLREERPAGGLVLSGIAAGLCAWTKNEGLLFLLITAGSLLAAAMVAGKRRPLLRTIGPFLAGSLPLLLMVLYFKIRLAPASYLAEGLTPAALSERLVDWSRYADIARAFIITGISFTQGLIDLRVGMHLNPGAVSILLLIAYLFFAGVRIDPQDRPGVIQSTAILCLTVSGYFLIYLLTPLDLDYHLATSLNRLFLQLWPGVVFLFFMAAGTGLEQRPQAADAETGPLQKQSRPARRDVKRSRR